MNVPEDSFVIVFTPKLKKDQEWDGTVSTMMMANCTGGLTDRDYHMMANLMARLCLMVPFLDDNPDIADEFMSYTESVASSEGQQLQ